MCQIFAYNGVDRIQLNQLLREFFSHSNLHPNGWGLAVLQGIQANIEREALCANKSGYLKWRLEEPVTGETVLAHIRYATIGNVELKNCHPFTGFDMDGRRWTLIHNGTIFEYPPMNAYVRMQRGDTDSERILLFLLDRMNEERERKGRPLASEELTAEMSEGNKLNLLLYDGELLYGHTNLEGSLYFHHGAYGVVVSTEPLVEGSIVLTDGGQGERRLIQDDWQQMPLTRLVAYKGGCLLYTGREHGHEYHEDPEAVSRLYLAFSNL